MVRLKLVFAAASRPFEGETANGDRWSVQHRDGITRVSIIDGLGHGAGAEEVARIAVAALEAAPELGAVDALLECDRALRGTRGAAASVIVIDTVDGRLDFAGIGNVAGRLVHPEGEQRLSADRGIVGVVTRRPHLLSLPLRPGALVLLHSDGIKERLDPAALVLAGRSLQELADELLATWGRTTDDATLVLAQVE